MNFFLFEKYGLNENEENVATIERCLEEQKAKDGWETKLNSKNDKIKSKAKEQKKQWTEDKEILLSKERREAYLKQYYDAVKEIIEYINDSGADESSFEEIATIQGVTLEMIKRIYEKHKDLAIDDTVNLSDMQQLAFKINRVTNAYNELVSKCNPTIKEKFIEKGINIGSLADILSISSCRSAKAAEDNSCKISKLAYELYDKQVFSSDIKNDFIDIFEPNSTKDTAVIGIIRDDNFTKFIAVNNGILFRYIRTVCVLMKKTEPIGSKKIANVAPSDKASFMNAMNEVFSVSFNVAQSMPDATGSAEKAVEIPSEVYQGEEMLKCGNFKAAADFFNKASQIAPYCWQAYWGRFKASISARTDEEIYFPGFLKELRESQTKDDCPDYINYYQSAKRNATEQKSTEINFDLIEMEYKQADKINVQFLEKVDVIKVGYIKGELDALAGNTEINTIKSPAGQKAALKIGKNILDFGDWKLINDDGVLPSIVKALIGFMTFFFGFVEVTRMEIGEYNFDELAFFACLALTIIVGIAVKVWSDRLIWGILSAIGTFLVYGILSDLMYKIRIISFVAGIPCVIVGLVLTAFGVIKIQKFAISGKKMAEIRHSKDQNDQEIEQYFIEEIENMNAEPTYTKYRIPLPDDLSLEPINMQ